MLPGTEPPTLIGTPRIEGGRGGWGGKGRPEGIEGEIKCRSLGFVVLLWKDDSLRSFFFTCEIST